MTKTYKRNKLINAEPHVSKRVMRMIYKLNYKLGFAVGQLQAANEHLVEALHNAVQPMNLLHNALSDAIASGGFVIPGMEDE